MLIVYFVRQVSDKTPFSIASVRDLPVKDMPAMSGASAPQPLKQQDMILVSFYHVSGGTTSKVPYEELVIQLWRDFPENFSLRNHPEHPDASDVHKKLYNGPLKDDGLIISLGNKVFRLTDKGVAHAAEVIDLIKAIPSVPAHDKSRLSREESNFIKHAQGSRALATWKANQQEKLVDYDARVFFQFSTGTKVGDRKLKVNFAREAIQRASDIGIEGADDLAALADFLVDNFDGLLKGVSL